MTLNTIKRCRGAHELNTWQSSLEEQGKRRFTIKPRSTVLHKKEKKTPERITSDISYSKCGERKEGTRAKRVLSIYQTNLLTHFLSLPFPSHVACSIGSCHLRGRLLASILRRVSTWNVRALTRGLLQQALIDLSTNL